MLFKSSTQRSAVKLSPCPKRHPAPTRKTRTILLPAAALISPSNSPTGAWIIAPRPNGFYCARTTSPRPRCFARPTPWQRHLARSPSSSTAGPVPHRSTSTWGPWAPCALISIPRASPYPTRRNSRRTKRAGSPSPISSLSTRSAPGSRIDRRVRPLLAFEPPPLGKPGLHRRRKLRRLPGRQARQNPPQGLRRRTCRRYHPLPRARIRPARCHPL